MWGKYLTIGIVALLVVGLAMKFGLYRTLGLA